MRQAARRHRRLLLDVERRDLAPALGLRPSPDGRARTRSRRRCRGRRRTATAPPASAARRRSPARRPARLRLADSLRSGTKPRLTTIALPVRRAAPARTRSSRRPSRRRAATSRRCRPARRSAFRNATFSLTRRNSASPGVSRGQSRARGNSAGAALQPRRQRLRSALPSRPCARAARCRAQQNDQAASATTPGMQQARFACAPRSSLGPIPPGLRRPCGDTAGRSSGPSSGAAAAASWQGSAATTARACTQNGGSYLNSTTSAQPTTMKPASKITNTAGPSPASANP